MVATHTTNKCAFLSLSLATAAILDKEPTHMRKTCITCREHALDGKGDRTGHVINKFIQIGIRGDISSEQNYCFKRITALKKFRKA